MDQVKRVAIYARVSTEEQAEHGYSIDAQLSNLRQYCHLQGKKVVGEYVDRGISGKEMTKRHELLKLLRDAENDIFDEVLVWKINRISRRTIDLLKIVEILNNNNVSFRSYSENFETETAMGRFALQMMGAVGELERNTIVDNVKMGMKQRARMGYHNGGVVLGYQSIDDGHSTKKGRGTKLEIILEEAIIVRKIFNLYASGKGLKSIANQLNHEGHRTKKGNPFGTSAIKEIINNPIYIGQIRYNRFEGWSEKRRRGKSSNPIIVPGHHEAIIDKELWEKVHILIQERSKVSPRVFDGISTLTGLIRCPKCGAAMVASRTVNYSKDGTKIVRRYYSCGRFRSQGSAVCNANSVLADYAEDYVIERVKEVLDKPKILKDIVEKGNIKKAGNWKPLNQELKVIINNLAQLNLKKKKLLEVYEMDGIDKETLGRRLDELKIEVDALHARKSEIEWELGDDNSQPVSYEVVSWLMKHFHKLIEKSSIEQVKTLFRLVIKDILVTKDKKINKIQLQFNENVISFFKLDPSAVKADGSNPFLRYNKGWKGKFNIIL